MINRLEPDSCDGLRTGNWWDVYSKVVVRGIVTTIQDSESYRGPFQVAGEMEMRPAHKVPVRRVRIDLKDNKIIREIHFDVPADSQEYVKEDVGTSVTVELLLPKDGYWFRNRRVNIGISR